MQEKNIETLVINKVENQEVYDAMVAANKINSNELYLVGGGEQVTGVKGANETTYRTGNVNLTAENVGALSKDTKIPSKTSDLTNDSDYATNSSVDTKLEGKADSSHTHDDRYYTESEVDSKLSGKSNTSHSHPNATTNTAGFMSAADKVKLNAIEDGANNYTHPTYEAKASGLYKITVDDLGHVKAATDVVKADITSLGIPAQDTTYSAVGTTGNPGLMTAADKVKLNGISDGANKTTVDTALSSTSTNPVQNKVINTKLTTMQSDIDSKVPSNRTINNKELSDNITLSAEDVGALPNTTTIPSIAGLATETYVDNKVAGLVNGAPIALDTLQELANALGNDANFSTTVLTEIGKKVDKVEGKVLSTNDLTATLKSHYDAAYTHSTSAHAPSNAEKNTIVGIKKNGTSVSIDSQTRTVDIVVPTKTSEIENDSGFLTQHQDLTDYAKKSDLDSKVDKDGNKVLSTNDFTTALKNNLNSAYTHSMSAHAPSNAERNTIVTIKRNGTALTPDSSRAVNITVPIKTSDLTNDSDFATNSSVDAKLANKVTVVSGKGLSTEDYTSAEKTKLSGIATGAEVNQNAFSNVVVGKTTVAADSKTDTLTLISGSNVTLTPDATNDTITIAATDTVYTHPSATRNNTTSTASPAHGKTFTVIDSITTNGTGHVTAVNTKTVTLPSDAVTSVNNKTGAVSLTATDVGALPGTVNTTAKTITTGDTTTGTEFTIHAGRVDVIASSNGYGLQVKNKSKNNIIQLTPDVGTTVGGKMTISDESGGNLKFDYMTSDNTHSKVALQNIKDPTNDSDAATKSYVDTGLSGKANSSHTHDYLPLSGGTLTGNLTGKYITGTWLQSTAATELASTPTKYAVLDSSGWVYYRTADHVKSDLGIPTEEYTADEIQTLWDNA